MGRAGEADLAARTPGVQNAAINARSSYKMNGTDITPGCQMSGILTSKAIKEIWQFLWPEIWPL